MDWLQRSSGCAPAGRPGCWSPSPTVRGHAPREPAPRWSSAPTTTWGSVGGGNLEAVAVTRARECSPSRRRRPRELDSSLSDKAPARHGVQCCGGEVTLLLEPLPARPAVAIFGVGHVGCELARILARHELDLHLVDSRAEQLGRAAARRHSPTRSPASTSTTSRCSPELVLGRAAARHPRAGHDPRPRRGCRPLRRGAAHAATSARSG